MLDLRGAEWRQLRHTRPFLSRFVSISVHSWFSTAESGATRIAAPDRKYAMYTFPDLGIGKGPICILEFRVVGSFHCACVTSLRYMTVERSL